MKITDLPNDILILIFLDLNCDEITLAHNLFKNLDLDFLINLRKNKGYPRSMGHCVIHHIPKSVIRTQHIIYENYYYSDDETSDPYTDKHKSSIIMDYLKDKDIIKGDLVIFNSHHNCENGFILFNNKTIYEDFEIYKKYFVYQIKIFDGNNLINLDYINHGRYHYLPKEFFVIEQNVPLDYWSGADHSYLAEHINISKSYYGNFLLVDYFDHKIIRFNIKLVIDQCINNIKFECILNEHIYMYTTFIYNNITYRVIYYKYMFNKNKIIYDVESFKNVLLDDTTLFNISDEENTLYVKT